MKQTVTEYDFIDAFKSIRPENFSYDGLIALFEYFEQMDDDCGTETELDVIAICCDFTEYESLNEFNCDYDNNWSHEDIADHTIIIDIPASYGSTENGGFIIQGF